MFGRRKCLVSCFTMSISVCYSLFCKLNQTNHNHENVYSMDGTDCVMLSGETANGPYFEEAVKVMARTCCEAQHSRNYNSLFQSIRNTVIRKTGALSPGESLASSAVKTAVDIDAKLIVVVSESGNMGRLIAKFRPGRFVIVLTPSDTIARQCSGLLTGVRAYAMESTDLEQTEKLVEEVVNEALRVKLVNPGDLMVGVWGKTHGRGLTDTVRVHICQPSPGGVTNNSSRMNFQFFESTA